MFLASVGRLSPLDSMALNEGRRGSVGDVKGEMAPRRSHPLVPRIAVLWWKRHGKKTQGALFPLRRFLQSVAAASVVKRRRGLGRRVVVRQYSDGRANHRA